MKIQIPDLFNKLFEPKRFKVLSGGRGSGKSENVARWLLICSSTSFERVLCTREYQTSISSSVHKVLKDIINQYELPYYEIFEQTIRNSKTGSEFIFRGMQDITSIKSMKGVTKCWCEEAMSLTKNSLDVLIPTIREPNSELIFTFNRVQELDAIYERFCLNINFDTTWHLHTTFRDNPFFPDVLKKEMENDKKNRFEDYLHIWEGNPINQTEKAIISRLDIADAINREVNEDGAYEVGVDVARFGADTTVLSKRKGLKLLAIQEYSKLNTVEVVGKIIDFVNGNKKILIKVDDTGVGGGVTDLLLSYGHNVVGLNFGSSPKDKDKYNNLISEAWFEFKAQINEIQLIDSERLSNELATREWKIDNKGRRVVESKDEYKKRGYQSPDVADSVLICFYNSTNVFNDKFDLTTGLTKESFY